MNNYRLLIDLETNRVIWFTNNTEDTIVTDSRTAIATFTGNLPEKLTVTNCWNFVFKDKKLVNTVKETDKPVSLLEQNRNSISKYCTDLCDIKLTKKLPVNLYLKCLNELTLKEANLVLEVPDAPVRWLNLVKNNLAIASNKEAAVHVLQQEQLFQDILYKIVAFKADYLKQIKNATTSEELFAIKEKLSAALDEL